MGLWQGRWPLIVFTVLIINYFLAVHTASIESKFITNCTVDDLRNINDQYKTIPPAAVSFEFSQCNLSTLPDAFFINVSGLQTIDFENTTITSISSSAFSGLNKLEVLRIVGNLKLAQLQLWTAHNLDKLVELDLHNNGIYKLDEIALRRYPNLKNLNLQQNFIDEVPNGFLDLSFNLETLNLAKNSLQRIESDTFKALLRLVDLDLAFNQINYIDSYAFTTTTRLKTLLLNGNQIKSIDSMVFFNLARLEYLNLSENALNGYALEEDAFKQNVQLLNLDLSYNSINTVTPNALRGLNSLQVLNISNNQLISVSLKDLGNLESLDISNNKLTHLMDNQFAFMTSVQSINISHNQLNSIKQFTFTDLSTLQTLDLSSNYLQDDAFLDLAAPIKVINLKNNAYQKINLTALNSIGKIYLNENPWNCSWLLNAVANKQHVVKHIQFGYDFDGFEHENATKPLIEELECFDYRQSLEHPKMRKIVIINTDCEAQRAEMAKKKRPTISTYPRTFNKLLSDEFDYKACLLWTVVAVCLVIGLVRLGKYCLDQSEKKSERYRKVQQEQVLKDIDDYFSKNNRRHQRS